MRNTAFGLALIALCGALGGPAFAQEDKLSDKVIANNSGASVAAAPALDFGDDASQWANDGECDDPRFTGPQVDKKLLEEDELHDASDCRVAYEAGTATLRAVPTGNDVAAIEPALESGIDFGDNTSEWANDGECDDPRFMGEGVDGLLVTADLMHDAQDCRALFSEGKISVIPVYHPDYAAGAPYDSTGVDFGDDSSSYANNVECDDPRFMGPGTASTLLDEDILHDAADCKAAYEAGSVALKDAPAAL